MKKSQQSTLFQTWGYYGKHKQHEQGRENPLQASVHQQQTQTKKRKATASTSSLNNEDNVIDLVDFDDDDMDLLQCVESVEQSNKKSVLFGDKSNKNCCHKTTLTINAGTEKEVFLDNHPCMEKSQETIQGFDASFGSTYIYPTNYPIRDYQFNIIRKAILKNTLVVLPTGLGKTFIAAVVMYNFYRWYPQRKLIFMAPTKPLVAQQIEACHNIMGIPQTDTSEMTGALSPNKRQLLWQSRRVFFMTPQVLQNDLYRGMCGALDIVCLVFDEAHKALGNHSYSQVIKEVLKHHSQFRVLALSATPGSDMKAVQEVVNNLLISHVELRSDDSIDIQKYVHDRKVEKIVVPLCDEINRARKTFLELLQSVVIRLHGKRAIWQNDASKVSKFMVLKAREQWRANNACQDRNLKGSIEGDFALLMSLYHALDLLLQHGLLSFYNFLKGALGGHKGTSRCKLEMSRNPKFMDLMEDLHAKIEGEEGGNQSLNETIMAEKGMTPKQRLLKSIPKTLKSFSSHPKIKKLEEIVVAHFKNFQEKNNSSGPDSSSQTPLNTRIMIFSQFRDSVQEITSVLSRHEPLVKVMSFIGQGSKEQANKKNIRGLSQKEQIEILRRFRTGGYNTVVSTSVGEEGLDIGDVDLIICFDASSSPIRLVQRMGRTGRKRDGKIVILVGEGKEESVYKRSVSNKKGIHKNLVNASRSLKLYDESPRMIPKHLNPKCYKMNIVVEVYQSKQTKASSKKKQNASETTTKRKSSIVSRNNNNNNSIKRFTEKGLLDENETKYLENTFQGDMAGCKNCHKLQRQNIPNSNSNNNNSSRKRYCHHLDINPKPLSLSAWLPWQTSTQSTNHSARTSRFCAIMESAAQFRSATEVEEYEKWLASKFKKTDIEVPGVANNDKKNSPSVVATAAGVHSKNGKHKKQKTPTHKLTGKDWRKTLDRQTHQITAISDGDSDIDDFSEKLDKIVNKNNNSKKIDADDQKYKPCSLEEMLEKQEERLSAQRKKKVRVTRLPKPPKIDIDLSDVEDQQIGFCSQVSMDTLYNRCQKKRKRDQLEPLFESEPSEDGDRNKESDLGIRHASKKTKYNRDNDCENEGRNLVNGGDIDLFEGDDETQDIRITSKNNKYGGNNEDAYTSYGENKESVDNSSNMPDEHGDVMALKNDENIPAEEDVEIEGEKQRIEAGQQSSEDWKAEKDKKGGKTIAGKQKQPNGPDIFINDNDDGITETQFLSGMFPMGTPTKLRKRSQTYRKTENRPTVTTATKKVDLTVPDAVPEAPSEIELSSFLLFDSSFVPADEEHTAEKVVIPSDTKEHRKCSSSNSSVPSCTNRVPNAKKCDKKDAFIVNSHYVGTMKPHSGRNTVVVANIVNPQPPKGSKINTNDIDMDTMFSDSLMNGFDDYDVNDIDCADDDIQSSPPVVSQRNKLPSVAAPSKKSPIRKRGFNFQIPNLDQDFDVDGNNDDISHNNEKGSDNIKLNSNVSKRTKDFNTQYFDVENDTRSLEKDEKLDKEIANNQGLVHGINAESDVFEGGAPSEPCKKNVDGDNSNFFYEEDSPVFVKPKRMVGRKKNRRIMESQATPLSDVKAAPSKRMNGDIDYDDSLLFAKPKTPGGSALLTSPECGGSSIRGENVKSFGGMERVNRRFALQQKRRQAKLFLDTQCADDDVADDHCEEVPMNGGCEDSSFFDNNQYVMDSFIDDATQPTPGSVQNKNDRKGRTPVDMNFIYRQSLMSPRNNGNNGLHFHTPVFKTNRNRYKLANLAEKYENISHDESSEAEEVVGLLDSEEEERQSLEEEAKRTNKKNKNKGKGLTNHNNKKTGDERKDVISIGSKTLCRKPGRRIRMMSDSDIDEDEDVLNKKKQQRRINNDAGKTKGGMKNWCETYTLQELPAVTFNFAIDWKTGPK